MTVSGFKNGQQSKHKNIFLKKMTVPLVKVYETVNDYMNSAENRSLAIEIGSKVLTLFRSVLSKSTPLIVKELVNFI